MNQKKLKVQAKWHFVAWILILAFLANLSGLLITQPVRAASTLHVASNGTSDATCEDWDHTCDLETALDKAIAGDEIWVASGVYTPTVIRGGGSCPSCTATFQLVDDVAIFGGFAMTETLRTERNFVTNVTVLSGDIEGNDITTQHKVVTDTTKIIGDNIYQVVTGSGTNEGAILDGFTITAGYANGYGEWDNGGGMYVKEGNPTLANIVFSSNKAHDRGGGIYNDSANPILTNVIFQYNNASKGGGGMYNDNSSPTLVNITFDSNTADEGDGGAVYNTSSSPELTNVTFQNNKATTAGGGMYNNNSQPNITNANFESNTATRDGGGIYNTASSSPMLLEITFQHNTARQGGGISNGFDCNSSLNRVTFIGNMANNGGGGMYNTGGSPTLTNVTFSGNIANSDGGAIKNGNGSQPILTNVTFSNNAAPIGSSISNEGESNPLVRNTLFINSTNGNHCNGDSFDTDSNRNQADDTSCGSSSAHSTGIKPGILGNHGGNTYTVPLMPDSSAINAGDNTHCPDSDQRGVPRAKTAADPCDVGAVEVQPAEEFDNPPLAYNDHYTTAPDIPLTISPPNGVLANDLDLEHNELTAEVEDDVDIGTLAFNTDGTFTYTPPPGYTGEAIFTYHANDGRSNSSRAVVTILVSSDANTPPIANPDTYNSPTDTTLVVSLPGILANDTDANSDSLIAILNEDVSVGTLNLYTNGSFTYTPPTDYSGSVSFSYYASDGSNNSEVTTVTINISDEVFIFLPLLTK